MYSEVLSTSSAYLTLFHLSIDSIMTKNVRQHCQERSGILKNSIERDVAIAARFIKNQANYPGIVAYWMARDWKRELQRILEKKSRY